MVQFFIDSSHFIISGALVGLLVGMTGVGGGSLMTPLLTIIFGVAPTTAVGTDLAFAAITKGFGTAAHRLHGNVRWDIVGLLCLGSISTAMLTILILSQQDLTSQALNSYFRILIGLSVILTATLVIFKTKISQWAEVRLVLEPNDRFLKRRTVTAGAFIGVLVCITSIGAGVIGAAVITILYPQLKKEEASATDIAFAVPLTALCSIGYWWLGNINFELLIGLLIGSIPGIRVGNLITKEFTKSKITFLTIATLLLLGFMLLAKN